MLSHTNPCPPPGAGVALVAASALVLTAGARFAAAGLPDAEVFGLNKSPSVNFPGDADGAKKGKYVSEHEAIKEGDRAAANE